MAAFCDPLSFSKVFTANDIANAFKISENIYLWGLFLHFFSLLWLSKQQLVRWQLGQQ